MDNPTDRRIIELSKKTNYNLMLMYRTNTFSICFTFASLTDSLQCLNFISFSHCLSVCPIHRFRLYFTGSHQSVMVWRWFCCSLTSPGLSSVSAFQFHTMHSQQRCASTHTHPGKCTHGCLYREKKERDGSVVLHTKEGASGWYLNLTMLL